MLDEVQQDATRCRTIDWWRSFTKTWNLSRCCKLNFSENFNQFES
jgi:hypothetical protein